jgi:hypothetical protein
MSRLTQPYEPMSYALPTDPSLLEKFQISDLYNPIPEFRKIIHGLRRTAASPGVHSVNAIAIRASGKVVLLQVGKRGGVKQLWSFGYPTNFAIL